MLEVTIHNFNQIYPYLEELLKDASFIAIDAEFSGTGVKKISLFDTINEHYEKQRSNIQPYIITQLGISVFQRIPNKHEYSAKIFNFYLLPRPFPFKNRQFMWQATSLEFLSSHGFNFSQQAYNGISYLDEADEAILQQQLQNNEIHHNMQQLFFHEYEKSLKEIKDYTINWLKTADETTPCSFIISVPHLQYFVQKELRNCFPNIWTSSTTDRIIIKKIPFDSRKKLEQEEGSILENMLLESYIGFSKVFKLLVALKKPIVAHNALLDLMFMYQQFYKPLPRKYTDFKNNIHQLFPTIYDTKHLSFEMRDVNGIVKSPIQSSNSLGDLVDYFHHWLFPISLVSPNIYAISSRKENDQQEFQISNNYLFKCLSNTLHVAGWDSFYTGFVFIKMSVVFTWHNSNIYYSERSRTYFTHTQLMHNVKKFENCINVMRNNTLYLRLDGPDPAPIRPKLLYVKTLTSKPITVTQITKEMMIFGNIDAKQCTSKCMLVAVRNHSVKEIIQYFAKSKELLVIPYHPIRHSPLIKFFLWASVAVSSGGIIAWIFQKL